MEEKNTTPVVEEETTQPGEVTAQPTVEELQRQIVERDTEIERKEGVLQQTKRELKDARLKGGSKVEIDALGKRMEVQEEMLAGALDEITAKVSGEEEPRQAKQTYSQQLKERREKSKPEEPKSDPDAQRFIDYCADEGLHLDYEDLDSCDPQVKEALGEGRTFREGLKHLKDKMKTSNVDIDKLVEDKLQIALEQKLKALNLTGEGAGAPSGSNAGFEKAEQDYADGKISTSEYTKLRQEQGIL